MAQVCKDKICLACKKDYQPTSRNQKWCWRCKSTGYRGEPPFCGCGCGEKVSWGDRRKYWNNFVQGHHLRKFYKEVEGNPLAHPNPYKGLITWYHFACPSCGENFTHQDKSRKFCSQTCFHEYYRGENHPFWKGGKINNGYKFVLDRAGKLRREHVIVMEEAIGRALNESEVVHHIDEDRSNNSLNNLFLFHCNNCHTYHHTTGNPLNYKYRELHDRGVEAYVYPGRRKEK